MHNINNLDEDILVRVDKSPIYNRLKDLADTDRDVHTLLSIVNNSIRYANERSKLVIRYMKEYTLHDFEHQFRVLQHMARIVPDTVISHLQPLELTLLILSAFFHDIGMSPSERNIQIYTGLIRDEDISDQERQESRNFSLYCKSDPTLQNKITKLYEQKLYGQAEILVSLRISEYIRRTHAIKTKEIIKGISESEKWSNGFIYKDYTFGPILAAICESHNENVMDLESMPNQETSILVSPGEYVNNIFISIVLRLADLLDFDAKRTPKVLFDHLYINNPISLKEWQKHRSINSWVIEHSCNEV